MRTCVFILFCFWGSVTPAGNAVRELNAKVSLSGGGSPDLAVAVHGSLAPARGGGTGGDLMRCHGETIQEARPRHHGVFRGEGRRGLLNPGIVVHPMGLHPISGRTVRVYCPRRNGRIQLTARFTPKDSARGQEYHQSLHHL